MIFRTAFNRRLEGDDFGLKCEDESRTIQSDAKEADINVIVKRFGITGQLPVISMPPLNIDFSEGVFDFRQAQDLIIAANRSFMELPADVRSRFGNDPGLFVNFCSDPANLPEMRRLGLAVPEKLPEPPAPAPVSSPSA